MNVVEVYLPVLYESSVISRDHPLPIVTPINSPHGTVVSLRERERLGAKGEKERGGGGRRKEGGEEGENQEKRKRKKDEMRERKKGRKERNRILES